jgi:hypothetical protein
LLPFDFLIISTGIRFAHVQFVFRRIGDVEAFQVGVGEGDDGHPLGDEVSIDAWDEAVNDDFATIAFDGLAGELDVDVV